MENVTASRFISELAMCGRIAAVAVLTIATSGCVFNPYVDSQPLPDTVIAGHDKQVKELDCDSWPVEPGQTLVNGLTLRQRQALHYAECTRLAMEKKAGQYARLSSGGATILLQIAGLAGYRGIRGGNQAQVAALTTGGASLYGAQQYLYQKPREATYWGGGAGIELCDRCQL